MAIKGYVVRGEHEGRAVFADPDGENGYEPRHRDSPLPIDSADAACFAKLEIEAAGCTDVRISAIAEDGTETPLPSYEEALGEIERLGEIEGANILNANAIRLARENLSTTLGMAPNTSMYDLQNEARRRLGTDPLAALEAAEVRLLEAGGWTLAEPGEYGSEQWRHPKHGNECRMVAISMARKAAKKGSAQQP